MINGHPGKIAFLCLLCFTGVGELFAFSIPIPQVSLSPYTEVSIGDAREYVYYNDEILSELIWDMKPMTSIGLAADVGWKRGLQFSADFSAGIPAETGSMQDSDWKNLPYPGAPNWKTNYSEHDADLQFACQAAIEAGWEFETPVQGLASSDRITVAPSIGFRYMTWKWKARKGYLQHASVTTITVDGKTVDGYDEWSSAAKASVYGTPISYRQDYWIPEAGVTVSVPVAKEFRVDLGVSGSFWVWCNGFDTHWGNTGGNVYSTEYGTNYYDILSAGWLVEPKASVHWDRFKKVSFFLEGKWTVIDGLRGDTGEQSTSGGTIDWFHESDGAGGGAALNTVTIRLGVETKLKQ